jgi:deoxyribodipyrimidine photolyase-related protein
MPRTKASAVRRLVLVLGDQLNADSAAFDGFDPARDQVWMAEVAEESTHVWSHKARIALFLSAMRHFRDDLRARGVTVHYRDLEDPANTHTLAGELAAAIDALRPEQLVLAEPGDHRVATALREAAQRCGVPMVECADRTFLCSPKGFADHLRGRKQLRMEFFYRELRRRTGVLMQGDEPEGGQWNFDADNREPFPRSGPGDIPSPRAFPPDAITRDVIQMVGRRFAGHPGSLEHFDWPVTPEEARAALDDFITHRLADFGRYQDAMWADESELFRRPFLFHSRLSAALNLRLLRPREAIASAESAYRAGRVSLAAAEGFIRQILGWREYVRGIYRAFMPGYAERNAFDAREPLPSLYWTGDTDMACLRHALRQTLDFGYAHHIQRLMVTGLFAQLVGVRPQEVHEWYLAVYVDAVEWVELPNTLGMSQHADGGLMASKPYVATGKYIARMSNYCAGCRYDPAVATGERACPFTTLYWDFLLRHEARLKSNQRMALQVKNLARLSAHERSTIQRQARSFRASLR